MVNSVIDDTDRRDELDVLIVTAKMNKPNGSRPNPTSAAVISICSIESFFEKIIENCKRNLLLLFNTEDNPNSRERSSKEFSKIILNCVNGHRHRTHLLHFSVLLIIRQVFFSELEQGSLTHTRLTKGRCSSRYLCSLIVSLGGALIVVDRLVRKINTRRTGGGRVHGPQQHIDQKQDHGQGTGSSSIDDQFGLEITSRDHSTAQFASEMGAFFHGRESRRWIRTEVSVTKKKHT